MLRRRQDVFEVFQRLAPNITQDYLCCRSASSVSSSDIVMLRAKGGETHGVRAAILSITCAPANAVRLDCGERSTLERKLPAGQCYVTESHD